MAKTGLVSFTVFLIMIGCSVSSTRGGLLGRMKNKNDAGEKSVQEQEKKGTNSGFRGRYTFLDTINAGKEVKLSESDFTVATVASKPAFESLALTAQDQSSRFRIQVMASSQIETIRQERKMFEQKTDLPLFIAFDSPFYKLYAGDFIKRADAENGVGKIRNLGYNDAWIVRTRIFTSREEN